MEGVRGSAAVAGAIDLELHLGPPPASPRPPAAAAAAASTPTSSAHSGMAAIGLGLDLTLFTSPAESVADEPGSDRSKSERAVSSGNDSPLPLLDVVDLGRPSTPRTQDSEEPENKRVKTEQPAIPRLVKSLLAVQLPKAARRARRSTQRRASPYPPVAAAYSHRALDTVPAWVRAELLTRHDLPGDLPLHYVGEKVLRRSDVNSRQARFLFPSGAAHRLRAFLSVDEIAACGFDSADRKARREGNGGRAEATSYAGVPVSVYVSGGAGWGVSEQKLNKFHRSNGTVINGKGYRRFVGRCGLVVGDGVEFWAFRRPPVHRLCFLIAKRDDVYPPDCKA